jgi:hypothetical protein
MKTHTMARIISSPSMWAKISIRAALRILKDKNELIMDEEAFFTRPKVNVATVTAQVPPGLLKRLLRRFILGLPMVGAISIVQVLLSLPVSVRCIGSHGIEAIAVGEGIRGTLLLWSLLWCYLLVSQGDSCSRLRTLLQSDTCNPKGVVQGLRIHAEADTAFTLTRRRCYPGG